MVGIAKDFELGRNNLEIKNDYDKLKGFNIEDIRYISPYSGILIGPVHHKVEGLGNYSSIVQKLQKEEGFPPTIELRTESGELKITKTTFKAGLRNMLTIINANSPN